MCGGGIDLNPVHIIENVIKDPLPTLGAIGGSFIPGVGPIIGAGLGGFGGSLLGGHSFGESLRNGAFAGAGSAAFGGISDALGGGGSASPWVNPDGALAAGSATAAGGGAVSGGGWGFDPSFGGEIGYGAATGIPDLTAAGQGLGAGVGSSVPLGGNPSPETGGGAGAPAEGPGGATGGELSFPEANPSQIMGDLGISPGGYIGQAGGADPFAGMVASNDPTFGAPPSPIPATATSAAGAPGGGFSPDDLPTPDVKPGGNGWLADTMRKVGIPSSIGGPINDNKNLILPGAALGFNAIRGAQASPTDKALKTQAQTLAGQGETLSNYLQTGTLPPGAQAAINSATQSAKASIKSQYASRGLAGSSMERAALADVDTRASAQVYQQAAQLLDQGFKATQLSNQLYSFLLQNDQAKDRDLQNSIADFAAAAAGGSGIPVRSLTGALR